MPYDLPTLPTKLRLTAPLRTLALSVLLAAVAGCSTPHNFKSHGSHNLLLSSDVRSGSAQVNFYEVGSNCLRDFQGKQNLNQAKIELGIGKKAMYMVVAFHASANFTGEHTTTYEFYLTPRSGANYELVISYIDSVYGATLYERDDKGKRTAVELETPPACAAR